MSVAVPQEEPSTPGPIHNTAAPSTGAATTVVPADTNDTNNDNADSFGSRLRNSVSFGTGGPPKPGTMTRLKYASYLFAALLFCMVFRSVMSQYFGAFSFYSHSCDVLDGSGDDSATTTSAAPSPSPSSWHLPSVPPLPVNLPPAIKEAAELASALKHSCLEATVVYRVSFALAIFFILHLCTVSDLTCCVDDSVRDEMQTDYFGAKTCILIFLVLFCLFAIPTSFFAWYAYLCMYASALFLIIQIILIVDFAHEWNETWGDRSEENDKWMYYLMGITVLCFVAGVGMNGYGFASYTPHEDCNLHGFLLIANIMAGIIACGVAIWVPHGSLLPTSILFAYTTYLVISALRTSPDTRCGGTGGSNFVPSSSWWQMLLTSTVTAGALAYTASSVGGSDDSWDISAENEQQQQQQRRPKVLGHLPAYLYFYAIMVLASMYLAMLGTDWTVSGGSSGKASGAVMGFWVKIVTSWLTYLLYFWSLLAPYFCCKHRDYGYDVPDEW